MRSCNQATPKQIRLKSWQLTKHLVFCESDQEDIEQELQLHVMQRLPKYNPARGKLSTFVARIIRNKITSMLRFRTAQRRDYRRNGAWPDGALDDPAQIKHRQGHSDIEQASLKLDVTQALQSLPPEVRQVAEALKHKSRTTVAREFKLSRAQMARIMSLIRRRFESENLQEYL